MVVCGWVVMATFKYPLLVKALEEENIEYFKDISSPFAECGASNGVFRGCIGAVNGLAIKIKRPTFTGTLRDPGAYYCQKGFFLHALNCQGTICDNNKKVHQWISSRNIGSSHDSLAFTTRTVLYELLQQKKEVSLQEWILPYWGQCLLHGVIPLGAI